MHSVRIRGQNYRISNETLDRVFGDIWRGFDRAYGGKQTEQARELWVFTEVDFAALAEQIGAIGIRVERPEQFASAMEQALEADRPVIIDVVTEIEAVAPAAVI